MASQGGTAALQAMQKQIWEGSLPLEIRLSPQDCRTYDQADPYLIQCPRLAYLPFLLARLHSFFSTWLIEPSVSAHEGWLSFQEVPLRWHYPIGLLYDLFSGAEPCQPDIVRKNIIDEEDEAQSLAPATVTTHQDQAQPSPWKLTVHFTDWPDELIALDVEGKSLEDSFINAVKEADFIRNGTAKAVMSLGKEDSNRLWKAVEEHDLPAFDSVNQKLLNAPGLPLRHIPIKIYLPNTATTNPTPATDEEVAPQGSLRVVQSLVPPYLSSRQAQTLGTALHGLLPSIFPSRRNPLLAQPVLHGAIVPLSAPMEELSRAAAYADGFLHVTVAMMS